MIWHLSWYETIVLMQVRIQNFFKGGGGGEKENSIVDLMKYVTHIIKGRVSRAIYHLAPHSMVCKFISTVQIFNTLNDIYIA